MMGAQTRATNGNAEPAEPAKRICVAVFARFAFSPVTR